MSDPDEDALSWAGDDDPSLNVGAKPRPTRDPAKPLTVLDQAEAAEDRAVEADLALATKESAGLGTVGLIVVGVLAGVYLLYTIGWGIYISSLVTPLTNPFVQILTEIGRYLAVAATPLWLVTVLLLTQGRSWTVRLIWLLVGVLVLIPWPFIVRG